MSNFVKGNENECCFIAHSTGGKQAQRQNATSLIFTELVREHGELEEGTEPSKKKMAENN
jgi:hypothetical protein